MTQRSTKSTVEWYRNHVTASQIGFDPDGMCQKICRTARNIGSGFPSALAQQLATPAEHRVHKISDIRRGMVMYFDDPNDSNPYGHIVTAVGRVKGADPAELGSILVRSNSVQSNQLTLVKADYFPRYWGDRFVFAGTWINGVALDLPDAKVKEPKPALGNRGAERLRSVVLVLNDMIDNQQEQGDERLVRALRRDKRKVLETIERFSK